MHPDLDDVLQLVAAGELSPDEALELLADPPAPAPGPAPAPAPLRPAAASPGSALTGIRLRTPYRSIHVVGDPMVAEVVIVGPHWMRREGAIAVIENPDEARLPDGRFSFSSLPWGLAIARQARDRLIVRVNPALLIEADLTANDLRVSGCDGGLRLRMIAGAAKLDRVRGPLTIDAQSSSIKGSVGIYGDSHVRVEQCSIALALLAGSDVRIEGHNRLGKIALPGQATKGGVVDAEHSQATVGSGRDLLDIDALMSSVRISVDRL